MTGETDPGPQEPAAQPAETIDRSDVWERIKQHKVLQWGVAYLGGALAVAQAQELLANAFQWPNAVGRVVVVTLIVGLPIALTVAWYHGHRALRRISVGELSILSALVLIAGLIFTVALRRADAPAASATQALNVAPPPVVASTSGGGNELPNKVAVLPCENLSSSADDAYFASGLHQDIIWQLDKLRNLTPIPRLTMLRYAGTTLSSAEIAAELSVRALLGCTVRYAEDRARITAELVDSTGLQTLWQGSYEPSLADIADVFAVQADIAMNIADALTVVFTPGERELLEQPPTVSKDAYLLFLKGYEEPDYDKTIELFEQSVAADERFAAPRAALAFLWATELINTNYAAAISPEERAAHQAKVIDYAERALALDSTIPFARSALTLSDMLNWHWSEAYRRIVAARELTPNDVTQYDIFLLSYLGRRDEAMNVVLRGEQLYPDDPDNSMWRGWALGFAGDYDGAAERFAAIIDDVPGEEGRLLARDWLARMEIARGNDAAALEQLRLSEAVTAAAPQPLFMPMWAYAYGRLGRADDARRIVTEMQQRETAGTRFGAGGWAMASLAVGDETRALEWLEMAAAKAAAHEPDEGFFNLMALRANITNDGTLRQRPFVEVLDRIQGD
jgi:TolB-like protein/tetratricopeptide (TPR) repeat protein